MNDFKLNGVIYRLQYRKCGKPGCKCAMGSVHGPYWYSYDGARPAKYVGSSLPKNIVQALAGWRRSVRKAKLLKRDLSRRVDAAYQVYAEALRELETLDAFENGDEADPEVLAKLGLRNI
jgi:hypothetical protein